MPSPFRRIASAAERVTITVNGEMLALPAGEMLAAALLAEGIVAFASSPRVEEPRGPHCLMGSCFQCTATIDGVPHQRTCRATVRAGMRVEIAVAR
jgi:D-hydroxyproline dehydrogenase subunit gamma